MQKAIASCIFLIKSLSAATGIIGALCPNPMPDPSQRRLIICEAGFSSSSSPSKQTTSFTLAPAVASARNRFPAPLSTRASSGASTDKSTTSATDRGPTDWCLRLLWFHFQP